MQKESTLPAEAGVKWYHQPFFSLEVQLVNLAAVHCPRVWQGAELMVMKAFPWDRYRFSVLSVERPKKELQELLASHGYLYLCDHGAFGDQTWVDGQVGGE